MASTHRRESPSLWTRPDRSHEPLSGYVDRMPKDKLRAGCPLFRARTSYRGCHYIACVGMTHRFNGKDARDLHYAVYCCGEYRQCPAYVREERLR